MLYSSVMIKERDHLSLFDFSKLKGVELKSEKYSQNIGPWSIDNEKWFISTKLYSTYLTQLTSWF